MFLLVLLNGFFVAAEFSLVKLRSTRVTAMLKTHAVKGRLLYYVHQRLDAYLSACQLGITLASLGLGWMGEPMLTRLFLPVLQQLGIENTLLIESTAMVTAFVMISFLHIVVGELAPKSLAIRSAEKVSLWCATPLFLFYWMMFPAIFLLNHSAFGILRLFHLYKPQAHDSTYSEDELKLILRSRPMHTQDNMQVLAYSLDLSHLTVADLMRPFNETVSLQLHDSWVHHLAIIRSHRFSRYPVLDEKGHVSGIVHVKDLLLAQHQHADSPPQLKTYLRPVLTVSDDLPALLLLQHFRSGTSHFAIVGAKDTAPLGFVTFDDVLAALVGEIRDEFRQVHHGWLRLDNGDLLGKGSLPLFSLSRVLGFDIDRPEVGSIGGLIQDQLGRLPHKGERILFEGFDIVVKKMSGPRIVMVRVIPHAIADKRAVTSPSA